MDDLEYLKKATKAVNAATDILKTSNDEAAVRKSFSLPDTGWVCYDCSITMDNIMSYCHKCRKPREECC